MTELRVESTDLHAKFQAMSPDVPLPWDISTKGLIRIRDANGVIVCSMAGDQREAILTAMMIVTAVNTCGGFKAA